MGLIGRWVDALCEHEPELMREVLDRPWSDVRRWVDDTCTHGCLVGSCALAMVERKLVRREEVFEWTPAFDIPSGLFQFSLERVEKMLRSRTSTPQWAIDRTIQVGAKVAQLTRSGRATPRGAILEFAPPREKRSSVEVERIVKGRIARRLAVRGMDIGKELEVIKVEPQLIPTLPEPAPTPEPVPAKPAPEPVPV